MGEENEKIQVLKMKVWYVGSPAGLMEFLAKLAQAPIVSPYCRLGA